MKMKTNSIFATLIIASIFAACSEETKVNYSTTPVEKQNISTSITATGTIEPVTEVEVGTQVSGIIDRIYVDYNSVGDVYDANGADEVVYPEKQMASRIATKYSSDNILDFIHLDNNFSIYEMKAPRDWWGKTLPQIDVRKKYKLNVLTVKRGEQVFIPTRETEFREDDIAFVIGEKHDVKKFFKL